MVCPAFLRAANCARRDVIAAVTIRIRFKYKNTYNTGTTPGRFRATQNAELRSEKGEKKKGIVLRASIRRFSLFRERVDIEAHRSKIREVQLRLVRACRLVRLRMVYFFFSYVSVFGC